MKIADCLTSENHHTYFIADIGSNHEGSLDRALFLIELAARSGANCAKFQHFIADEIVSDYGFQREVSRLSHQKTWKLSVFDTYKNAETPLEWIPVLAKHCSELEIEFMTTPYCLSVLPLIKEHAPAVKIGSGDIDHFVLLNKILELDMPILLATGASTSGEVDRAVRELSKAEHPLCLMQCNTNYTGDCANKNHINLNVLDSYRRSYPNVILGLSDHTVDNDLIIGAVSKGCRVIERHFTDDRNRSGPDHFFANDPAVWREMVSRVRSFESALGDGNKKVEQNEAESRVVQRRSVRLVRNIKAGEKIRAEDLTCLRPLPDGSLAAGDLRKVFGKIIKIDKTAGQCLRWDDFE